MTQEVVILSVSQYQFRNFRDIFIQWDISHFMSLSWSCRWWGCSAGQAAESLDWESHMLPTRPLVFFHPWSVDHW